MTPELLARLEKLAASGIELVPVSSMTRHFVLARDGFAALVERTAEGFGAIGAAGHVDESGFAALVWRGGEARFTGKRGERAATAGDVEKLRLFERDLRTALE